MIKILPIIFLISSLPIFGQDSGRDYGHDTRRFVPLNLVQERGIKLTKLDTLNFRFVEGDTMVWIRPAHESRFPQGVEIKVEPRDTVFLNKYKGVVYGDKSRKDRDQQRLMIWKDGIRLFFDPTVPKKHQREIMKLAESISSEIDSLSIQKVSERDNANYLVFYLHNKEDFDLDPRIKNDGVGYYLNWNKGQYFTRASLKVNSYVYDKEEDLLQDLKMRFVQTLGHFRTSKEVSYGSLLSAGIEEKELSSEDLELLKYHYSFQNCPGVDLKAFESLQKRIQEKFEEFSHFTMRIVCHFN